MNMAHKHYYTIETFEGIIVSDSWTKAEAIKKGREEAINMRQSLTIVKNSYPEREVIDPVAIIEFPAWLRNWDSSKLNIKDTTVSMI